MAGDSLLEIAKLIFVLIELHRSDTICFLLELFFYFKHVIKSILFEKIIHSHQFNHSLKTIANKHLIRLINHSADTSSLFPPASSANLLLSSSSFSLSSLSLSTSFSCHSFSKSNLSWIVT